MEKLKIIRKKIDQLDDSIIKLLNERYSLVEKVKNIKKDCQLDVIDLDRENEILKKTDQYEFSSLIKTNYQNIFKISANFQKNVCYLVGKRLSYSYSQKIHNLIGNNNYFLKEIDSINDFVLENDFKMINVTNPFKKEALKLCQELSVIANETQVVNTIIKKDNKLIGYNTDYLGFDKLIRDYNVNLNVLKILIVGNGDTSRTIRYYLKKHSPAQVYILARNNHDNEEFIDNYIHHLDAEVIINATSYGVHPELVTDYLFDIDKFTNLETLIDVNYNPLRSTLCSNKNYCLSINGLSMLVNQAIEAEKLINIFPMISAEEITTSLIKENLNIVLIGMPYVGKTSLGKELAKALKKDFYDTDELLKVNNDDLNSILNRNLSIDDFRDKEANLIKKLSTKQNSVISCGGGAILNENNIKYLKQNSLIINLYVDLEELIKRIDDSRPLIKSPIDLEKIFNERDYLYQKQADFTINADENSSILIETIKELINVYFNY